MENLAANFRLNIANRERAHADSAIADLVPIVPRPRPTGTIAVEIQRWLESFFNNSSAQGRALLFTPGVVKPVISDSESMCHFRCVEEMPWIPILEVCGGLQFLPRAFSIFLLAFQPVK